MIDDINCSMVTTYFLDQIRRRTAGPDAFLWDLDLHLPIAPSIEEALRIATQDWDADLVDLYVTERRREGLMSLALVRGRPVVLQGLSDLLFAVFTDSDHRFRWRVTEVSSGCALSKPKPTEQAAVEAANRVLERFGPKGIRATVRSMRDSMSTAYQRPVAMPSPVDVVTPSETTELQVLDVTVPTSFLTRGQLGEAADANTRN